MLLTCRGTLFLILWISVESELDPSDTEDGLQVEYYDCFLVQSLSYCRRPNQPIDLIRDNDTSSCQQNGGVLHQFSELQSNKTMISAILHQWKSGIERVEEYSRYLRNESAIDGFLCQCTETSSFGKNCEYHLPFGQTFEQTLNWRLQMRKTHPVQVQIHGDIICYETLNCNSGQLCLDWREICDGIQHCVEGRDEENCDLLELNECDEKDEYRCMNGMCIPDEFFLDGEFDCLDWSDEIQYKNGEECATERVSPQCDDRLCPPNQWSCGDGQCIRDRLAFQNLANYATCHNRRDQYFMCEIHAYPLSWTMANGRCHEGEQYKASPMLANVSIVDKCLYLLRCSLSQGGEAGCPCFLNSSCTASLYRDCSPQWLFYPGYALITSYMFVAFWIDPVANIETRLIQGIVIHGTIKCRNSLISYTGSVFRGSIQKIGRVVHDKLCRKQLCVPGKEDFIDIQQCSRPNESTDVCDEWNPCLSLTRMKDGFINCLNEKDELHQTEMDVQKSCSGVRRHRFRCSIAQPTCLSVMALGNRKLDCENRFDEFWLGSTRKLSQMHCNDQRQDDCARLRQYIGQQPGNSITTEQRLLKLVLPFRFYCDTFWDLDTAEDESTNACQQSWVCATGQRQCRTGQCIEPQWVLDFEWDCPYAADETSILQWIVGMVQRNAALIQIPGNQSYFLSNTCNQINSFLCLVPQISHPQFYCIDQSEIGDGKIDCAGAIDERNTMKHCSGSSILGYNFKCASSNTCIPYSLHCQQGFRCPNRTDDDSWCSHQNKSSPCWFLNAVMCLNGTCVPGGRCNKVIECPFSEDEYMCDYMSSSSQGNISYREGKGLRANKKRRAFLLPRFPPDAHMTDPMATTNMTGSPTSNSSASNISISSSLAAFSCNRGIGILSGNDSIICFCPPQYFGEKCEYHNDRLSILLHLNLSQSLYTSQGDPNITLKLLILFLFENQTLMTHEFHHRPSLEINTLVQKKMVDLPYSHSSILRQQRKERYFNRSKILVSQPYSIQIELYEIGGQKTPSLIAVWKYSIFFDYLPVFRFAKVLHLRKVSEKRSPCSNDSCHPNEECRPLMNSKSEKIICLCKANFTGENCQVEDEQCLSGYCSSGSLCKPNYRRLLRGNAFPYCICRFGQFGHRCDMEIDLCQPNPCRNGGSCFPSARIDELVCLCPKEYYGDKCERKKLYIRLTVEANFQYAGLVIQFFDLDFVTLDLHLVDQQVYKHLPRTIEYYRNEQTVPTIVLGKVYSSYEDTSLDFYLLSLFVSAKSIDGQTVMSEINRCPHVSTLIESKHLSPIL